jgi:hypothetical protein
MTYGIRKGLEDVAHELKGIRSILASLWALQDGASDKKTPNPEMYADEYISTEECARRLSVSDQTIRNWISTGKNKTGKGGWIEGMHYVNVNPGVNTKASIRIPWNTLVRSFSKNPSIKTDDYLRNSATAYRLKPDSLDVYLQSLGNDDNTKEDDTDGTSL